MALRSPIDGVVIRKQADRGGFAAVGQELFAVADLGTMWAVAEVPESSTSRLGVGERVRVDLAAGPAIDGAIAFIHPTVDEASRTVSVRVELPNRDGALRPGMSATVHLAARRSRCRWCRLPAWSTPARARLSTWRATAATSRARWCSARASTTTSRW